MPSDQSGDVLAVISVAESGSAPSLAHRARALSCCWCSNDEWLLLYHQNQDPQRRRCRAARLCRPLGYGLAADLYQHPRVGEHETRGSCLCHLRTTHPIKVRGGIWPVLASTDLHNSTSKREILPRRPPNCVTCRMGIRRPRRSHATLRASRPRGSMTTPTVPSPPRPGNNRVLGELTPSLPGLHGDTAFVPDALAHQERFHLLYAGDAGITLSRDDRLVEVDLVRRNGAPTLTLPAATSLRCCTPLITFSWKNKSWKMAASSSH